MSLKSQKPQTMEESAAVVSDRHADIDFFIYATVGPLCFAVVLGFVLVTLYKYVRKHPVQWPWKRKFRHPSPSSFWPTCGGGVVGGDHRHRRMTDECAGVECGSSDYGAPPSLSSLADVEMMQGGGSVNVIYSGEFEQSQQQQLSGSWLDDASFVPDDSLDRIRTPTLLRTAPPPAAKNRTFTDMLQQCGGDHHQHLHRLHSSSHDGQSVAAAAVAANAVHHHHHQHAQSPRLSRDNKLRILGCKQSCLLLPAVQPATASEYKTTTTTTTTVAIERENDQQCDQP